MFVESYKIKLINSAPYYPRANGHANFNQIYKEYMEYNLKHLHKVLSEALWAHVTRHGAIKVTLF